MKKVELIFSMEKIERVKQMVDELKIDEIIFSEVNIYKPDLVVQKKYRGAEYKIELISKIKGEMFVEEDILDEIKKNLEEIIDTEKGDKYVII